MQDKKTLITIIVLLIICLPLTILGTIKHFGPKEEVLIDDNPNKELIYNNKVYLYNENVLLDTVDCDNCSKPETIIDDDSYHVNYYSLGVKEINPVVDNNWAIFKKGADYALYNILGHRTANYYQSIKTYNVELDKKVIIAKYNNSWGVSFLDMSSPGINYEYEYIALPAHLKNGVLDTSRFIAKKEYLWYILNPDGTRVRPAIRGEVTDFNDNYYVMYTDGVYHIRDYSTEDNEFLAGMEKKNVYGVGKYMFIVTTGDTTAQVPTDRIFIYENCNGAPLQTIEIPANYTTLYFSQNTDGIAILIDGKEYQKIGGL